MLRQNKFHDVDLTDYSSSKLQPLLESDEDWGKHAPATNIEVNEEHFSPSTMLEVEGVERTGYVELKGEPSAHRITDASLQSLNTLLVNAKKEFQSEQKGHSSYRFFSKSAKAKLFDEIDEMFPEGALDAGELNEVSIALLSNMTKSFSTLSMMFYARARGASCPVAAMMQNVSIILSDIAEKPKQKAPSFL